MNAALIVVYLLIFLLGPALVVVLMRRAPGTAEIRKLGAAVLALVFAGLALQFAGIGGDMAAPFAFWVAWVISMALMGQVLRLMLEDPQGARRWTAMAAAVGATIPWFGILMARMMVA